MKLTIPSLACLLLAACQTSSNRFGHEDMSLDVERLPRRIAFGSCAHQDQPQPVLDLAVARDCDLFVYLGDNIYGDTEDMQVLEAKYRTLSRRPEFRRLRAHCPLLAVWDDHDYGANDAGRHYAQKEASREVFLDFWGVPSTSPRRARAGIHHDHVFRDKGRTLQVILLDTRTFRDDLITNGENPVPPFKNDYRPNPNPEATFLGDEQWAWLEERLRIPADLRIIATSNQFGHAYNGWESWTNVPHERQRMIDLIVATRANGCVFISGDVHWGEISRQPVPGGYALHDVTSSGINRDWPTIEPNQRRIGDPVRTHNFGLIEVDWDREDPQISLVLVQHDGSEANRVEMPLSSLTFER